MSSRDPSEIWHESVEEGERRLERTVPGLLATAGLGGLDVMLGVVALTVVSGAVHEIAPEETAHVAGSLAFGIGFVMLIIGRAELFTENFLVPVTTVVSRTKPAWTVLRLWGVTLVGNVIALVAVAYLVSRSGVLPESALQSASSLAETIAERDSLAALFSAIVAGALMTLLTWLTHAVDNDTARVAIALLIGFLLAVANLNHAVVGIGEMSFGIFADRGPAEWADLVRNFALAVAGNMIGGLALTGARLAQVEGDPQ